MPASYVLKGGGRTRAGGRPAALCSLDVAAGASVCAAASLQLLPSSVLRGQTSLGPQPLRPRPLRRPRILVGAGCWADHSFPGANGEHSCPPALRWFFQLNQRQRHLSHSVAFTPLELEVSQALLEAIAREHAACEAALAAAAAAARAGPDAQQEQAQELERLQQEQQRHGDTAAALVELAARLGNLPLLRLVLRTLPHAVRECEARDPAGPQERQAECGSEWALGALFAVIRRLQAQLNSNPPPPTKVCV